VVLGGVALLENDLVDACGDGLTDGRILAQACQGQDPAIREAIATRIDKIVLQKSDAPKTNGFSLDDPHSYFRRRSRPHGSHHGPADRRQPPPAHSSRPPAAKPAARNATRSHPPKPAVAKSTKPKTPAFQEAAPKKAGLKKPVPKKKRR